MIWGCITTLGIGALLFFNGSIDGALYLQLLKRTVKPFLRRRQVEGIEDPIYMYDNASVHRATAVKNWVEENDIYNPDWPPYSPDLNGLTKIVGIE